MIDLEKSIKINEGFVGFPYNDKLGILTIGYGTKLPLTEEESEMLLMYRLDSKRRELLIAMPFVDNLPDDIQKVLFEMSYQMGVAGVLLFKRMWSALKSGDFERAANEMLDSKWAIQTPERAKMLSDVVRSFK